MLVLLNINTRVFGPWLLSKLWESHWVLFVTLSVPQQAEYGRHHENTVWHVSILVSDWIKHSSHNILSLMFSAGEVVTCSFLELLKCSQNWAVAHPYSTNSIVLFLFCLENLVKMGLAQKKSWARHHKAWRSELSSAAWWLSGCHMTSIWRPNPTPDVSQKILWFYCALCCWLHPDRKKTPSVATLDFHRMEWQFWKVAACSVGLFTQVLQDYN